MKKTGSSQAISHRAIRRELAVRLRDQATEIEEALFSQASALPASIETEKDDAEYVAGRRAAIAELVDYAIDCIELAEEDPEPPIPLAVAAQARRSARMGVGLDTIMRRYAAGDRLFGKFVMDEAGRLPSGVLWQILIALTPRLDGLLGGIAAEYTHETERLESSAQRRLRERVDRLLAQDPFTSEISIDYDFKVWHLGIIVTGTNPEVSLRTIAAGLGRNALVIPRSETIAWGWLAGAVELPVGDVERIVLSSLPEGASVAVGEPRQGVDGWRLTHREALAALQVMLHKPQRFLCGSNVMLLAAVLRDGTLADAFRQTYLAPLAGRKDSGEVLQETLRAYFSTGGNAMTTAAILDVNRQTVQRRLRKVEQRLGKLIQTCQAELEVALSLEQLDHGATNRRHNGLSQESE